MKAKIKKKSCLLARLFMTFFMYASSDLVGKCLLTLCLFCLRGLLGGGSLPARFTFGLDRIVHTALHRGAHLIKGLLQHIGQLAAQQVPIRLSQRFSCRAALKVSVRCL